MDLDDQGDFKSFSFEWVDGVRKTLLTLINFLIV